MLENTALQLRCGYWSWIEKGCFWKSYPPYTPRKFLTMRGAKEKHKALCFPLPLPFSFDLHQDVS